jgi:hypothetical protein
MYDYGRNAKHMLQAQLSLWKGKRMNNDKANHKDQ